MDCAIPLDPAAGNNLQSAQIPEDVFSLLVSLFNANLSSLQSYIEMVLQWDMQVFLEFFLFLVSGPNRKNSKQM